MLRTHSRELEIAHKVIDLLIVLGAWWLSYFLRFETVIPAAEKGLELWYLKAGVVLLVLSYYYFRREGLYTSKRLESLFKEIMSVIKANTLTFIMFVLFIYFLTPHKASRLFLVTYYIASSIGLVFFKIAIRNILNRYREKGKNLRYAVLVGSGKQLQEYAKQLYKHKEAGIVIKAWVDSDGVCNKLGIDCYEHFTKDLFKELSPDIVVIGYSNKEFFKTEAVTKILINSFAETIVLPDLSHSLVGYNIVDFYGLPMIMLNEPNIKSRSIIVKRVFDIISSFLGILILSPLLLLISFLVKRSSSGPILYSQVRMGLDGKKFKMYKFRSMSNDSKVNQEGWTVKDDPRVTKIGKLIRKTSLDELPQLWNVFIGDMSLVGPRPERPQYVEKFREDIPTYMLRHKMKAGITGWAQINGWRGDTSIEKRIECDLYYIRNWSIWMDISIIFMTFWKGFINKNAY